MMNWTQKQVASLAAVAVSTLMTLPAHADVVNGGFETGTFAGWTQTGDTGFTGVDPFAARTGSFGAFFGPELLGGISQSFATLAGTPYRVDFSLSLADSAQPNSFSWSWNGVTQAPSLTNAAAFGYTNFSAVVTATGASSSIGFNFRDPQSFWLLDNVAVTAVPEPPAMALLGVGLLLLTRTIQRRAKSHRS
jgi:MYXO-CTERM domain-containing protein